MKAARTLCAIIMGGENNNERQVEQLPDQPLVTKFKGDWGEVPATVTGGKDQVEKKEEERGRKRMTELNRVRPKAQEGPRNN